MADTQVPSAAATSTGKALNAAEGTIYITAACECTHKHDTQQAFTIEHWYSYTTIRRISNISYLLTGVSVWMYFCLVPSPCCTGRHRNLQFPAPSNVCFLLDVSPPEPIHFLPAESTQTMKNTTISLAVCRGEENNDGYVCVGVSVHES